MEEVKEKAIELFNVFKQYYDDEKAKEKVYAMIDRSLNKYRRILNTTDNPITVKYKEVTNE